MKAQFRRPISSCIYVLIISMLTAMPVWAVVHSHCDVIPWSLELTQLHPVTNASQSDFFSPTGFPSPAAQVFSSSSPHCLYEISDTLTFTMTVNFTEPDSRTLIENRYFRPPPSEFFSGIPEEFTYPDHQTAGGGGFNAIDMHPMIFGRFSFRASDGSNFDITSIDYLVTGNHYYRETEIPEPSTFLLICICAFGWRLANVIKLRENKATLLMAS